MRNLKDLQIKRGDIYYVDFGETKGSEQGGIRPCVIIQNDIGNKFSPTVIVNCITSQIAKAKLPTHVEISSKSGLKKDSIVLCEQVKTIDKTRLIKYIGRVDGAIMNKIDIANGVSIGLEKPKNNIIRIIENKLKQIEENEIVIANMTMNGFKNEEIISHFVKGREIGLKDLEVFCKENNIDYRRYYKPYNCRVESRLAV